MRNLKFFIVLVFSLSLSTSLWGQDEGPNAFQVWSQLKESESSFKATEINVFNANPDAQYRNGGTATGVTYGAEKEGSSSRITKVMGPTSENFSNKVYALPESQQKEFLAELLDGYTKGRYRQKNVVDVIENVSKDMDLSEFRGLNFYDMELDELKVKFNRFLELSDGRPFSFLTNTTKQKIFNGNFTGLTSHLFGKGSSVNYGWGSSSTWVENFGKPQKYIESVHGTSTGWEILFNPQKSYGEFEEMIDWFKTTMGSKHALFEAPGHQRLVYPRPNLTGDALKVFDNHLKEMYKTLQSYIILKEFAGKTGLEYSSYKSVFSDESLLRQIENGGGNRGVIRFEKGRWGQNTDAIELRTGTKTARTQRFVQQVVTSRVASSDFGGMVEAQKYVLIPDDLTNRADIANRLGLEVSEVDAFFNKIGSLTNAKGKYVQTGRLAPLFLWENAPYISKEKAKQVKDITADWIRFVGESENLTNKEFSESLAKWARSTNIQRDMERYLSPVEQYNPGGNPGKFKVASGAAVDVNKVDLGIEYSGRFPIKFQGEFTDELAHGKREWVQSLVDLTEAEREGYIKKVSQSLEKRLKPGVGSNVRKVVEENAHGHGLSIAYEFEDAQDRTWRLEWDGIGRSYDAQGNVLENSARSGHIELVTPKFQPTYGEMEKVFASFDKYGVIPSIKMGGGHINIDLAPFDGKPKQLARFLSIYHENRGVMSMMFQDYGRYKSAEAIPISDNLSNQLRNFNGSEDELKKLLYNERYFNTRVGRKTRYIGLDMSAYYQDVIPEKFLHADFDISNPDVLWKEQFRVNPKIRKMEFRMFNAPRTAYESALQQKLVRAMMNKALNEDGALSGIVQDVDYEKFARDPQYANEMLEKMCRDLGLDANEYKVFLNEGISEMQIRLKSPYYKTISQRLADFPKINTWGQAIETPRTAANAINSEDRVWRNGELPIDEQGNFKPYVTQEAQQHYVTRKNAVASANGEAEFKLRNAGNVFKRNQCSTFLRTIR